MNMQLPVRFFHKFSRAIPIIKIRLVFRRLEVYHIIFLFCACVSAVCLGILFFRLVILPGQSDAAATEARSLYRNPAISSSAPQSSPAPQSSTVLGSAASSTQDALSFSELKAINPDVEGWITLPGTMIDYPVLRAPASTPDYYLTHDWKHNATKYGSIYLYTPPSKVSVKQKNTILYGHSMKDGRMFADLLQYDNLAYYRLHPTFLYQDSGSKANWKIFAVIKTNTDLAQGPPFDYQKTRFASTHDFSKYLYEVRIRSILNIPVDVKTSDDILMLSTCSYEFDGFRTVICARRVRMGESTDVDTANAEINSEVLYPDCWYKKFGGEKPSLPNFQ
jgi:sortase B